MSDFVPVPDKLTRNPDTFQAQGPSAQTVGTRYAAVEYIEVQQQLPMGPQGPVGPTGPAGEDGAEFFFGTGDPNEVDGPNGNGPNDVYVDEDTGIAWKWDEISQSWISTGITVNGPTGPTGAQGATGPTGPTGPQGIQGGGIKVEGTFPGDISGTTPPSWTGVPGEGWIDAAGNLWGWQPEPAPGAWFNYGPIVGPTGPMGPGVIAQSFPVSFAADPDTRWASQIINHTLALATPSARLFLDLSGTGVYSVDQTVGITYPSSTQVKLTAEASIMTYNGRGQVVLQ